jgi:hypothetical protein
LWRRVTSISGFSEVFVTVLPHFVRYLSVYPSRGLAEAG